MDQQHRPTHRRLTRAEVRRRRRSRAIRRVAGLTAVVCLIVGGAAFLLNRKAPVPSASAAGAPASSAASETNGLLTDLMFPSSTAESTSAAASEGAEESRDNALGLTKAEAAAMLADPMMVLVNHTNKMPDNYTFDTKECGSQTAVNKTLQTPACDAFLEMQKAAAADGVTVWMQSGYRSVKYQTGLYERKSEVLHRPGAYDTATAKEMARRRRQPAGLFRTQLRPCRRPEQPRTHRAGREL
mgnify:CR=1 FL=1